MARRKAQRELEKGIDLSDEGNFLDALQHMQQALEIFSDAGNAEKTADTLLEMGKTYCQMGENDFAQESYYNALELYKDTEDLIGEGYAYVGMAEIQEKRNRYDESRNTYHKAIKIFKKAGDSEKEAKVVSHLASTLEAQGAYHDAIYEHERSIEISKNEKNLAGELYNYGRILKLENKIKTNRPSNSQFLILIGYLGLLILGEVVTTYSNKEIGLIIHFSVLVALLVQSSFTKSYTYATLLRSMMVLPIIRIIGLTMPLMNIPTLYLFPIIAVPLFASSIALMKIQGINRKRVGLIKGNLKVQLIIALTGPFLGFIEYNILNPLPLIHTFDVTNLLFGAIILTISTGLAEELLFRGIIQKNSEDVLGIGMGLLYTSLLFTSLHIGWNSIQDLVFVFCVAMFYGFAFQKTRSLLGITLSHGISNSVLFLVMPFLIF
ncbi:MAG: tetratricopeptide repeat protein [Methanobacteriaceae archaeon]|nr:tetratricopeptide repeat protein [Methanobacteriaceae archaeon]